MEYGKIPPQALKLEEAVLGAIMIESNAILKVSTIIKPESFYKEAHQKIYLAIKILFDNHKGIDMLTVCEQLKKQNDIDEIGGPAYISQLTTIVSSTNNLEYHAKIVQQKYIAREMIRISSEISERSFDDSIDIKEVTDYAQSELFNIICENITKDSNHISVIGKKYIDNLIKISLNETKLLGVPSGFTKLDRITSGWQDTDLIIIAARPGIGKTTITLEYAVNAASMNYPVDFYSLEMSESQLYNKILSRKTGLENCYIRSAKMNDAEWIKIENCVGKIEQYNLHIDDTPALTLSDFRAKTMMNKMKYGTRLIIIDYLQLMRSPSDFKKGNRESEVSAISRGLKAIAKELNVPIIALAQLNRAMESRGGNKRPQLSDLRESGAIEQDADMVIFIHRPELYGITVDEEGNSTKNVIQNIISKHRNGALGDIDFYKNNNWTYISDHIENDYNIDEHIEPNLVF
jgi:replicative DNA helicase